MRPGSPYRRYGLIALVAALAGTAALGLVLGVDWDLAWLGAAGLVTFALYGLDKRRARRGDRRVPESVLHAAALVGGFLGAWAGRAVFRHKTRDTGFLVVLIVSSLIWGGLLLWWHVAR